MNVERLWSENWQEKTIVHLSLCHFANPNSAWTVVGLNLSRFV
jgi:hypothetical protein